MKKKYILCFLLFFIFFTNSIKAWESNATGGYAPTGTGGIYCDTDYGYGHRYCRCNNTWFSAFDMRLVYYDGSSYRTIGTPIRLGKYASGLVQNSSWIQGVFGGSWPPIQDWGIVYNGYHPQDNPNFANQLKDFVNRDLDGILSRMGVNRSRLEADIRSGVYPKHKRARGNFNDTGVRLIVEPLYGISEVENHFYPTHQMFGTAKGIAQVTGCSIYQYEVFSNAVYLERDDIGFHKGYYNAPCSEARSSQSGIGMAIFSPFDTIEVDPRCDPGSSKSSIQACCRREGIDYGNQTNNNTSKLKHKISDSDLKRYCPIKCDKTKEGVETCCEKFGITPENQENNTDMYLKHLLTQDELTYSLCNPDYCKYEFENTLTNQCKVSTTGHISDANNEWKCVFRSSKHKSIKLPEDEINKIKNHFIEDIKNDYCSIYCTETIDYMFPQPGTETKIGRYLVLFDTSIHPTLFPIKYKSTKTCRTTNKPGEKDGKIDNDKFTLDYNNAVTNMVNAFNSGDQSNGKKYSDEVSKIISQMEQCNNYQINSDFSPEIDFDYEDPVYGGTYKLKVDTDNSSEVRTAKHYMGGNASDGTGTEVTNSLNKLTTIHCSMFGCGASKQINFPMYTWNEFTLTKELNYKLANDNQYRYISKVSGKSFSSIAEAGGNSIDIGFANLPIHYSATLGDKSFKVTTKSFGKNNKFERYFFEGETFANKSYSMQKDYNCKYTIVNPDPDIDESLYSYDSLVFRAISLESEEKAFPGKTGSGRNAGINWKNYGRINAYILNNRNVRGYDLYKQDPMYEITLTPKLMQQIREYDKKENAKLVTLYNYKEGGRISGSGVAGYTNYENIECLHTESKGPDDVPKCISREIREWGVRGCAVKTGNSAYKKCSFVQAWW